MARFKLLSVHYLNVEGATFRQELKTNFGKRVLEEWDCHQLLNPDDPGDCNYNVNRNGPFLSEDDSEDPCIVINTKPFRKDIVVRGEFLPSAMMEPLDDEAHEMLANYKPRTVMQALEEALPVQGVPNYDFKIDTKEFADAVANAIAQALKGDPYFHEKQREMYPGSVYTGHMKPQPAVDLRP